MNWAEIKSWTRFVWKAVSIIVLHAMFCPEPAEEDNVNLRAESGHACRLREPSKEALEETAARFSQASAELQLLGLLRSARKRRGDFAHNLAPHLESSLK